RQRLARLPPRLPPAAHRPRETEAIIDDRPLESGMGEWFEAIAFLGGRRGLRPFACEASRHPRPEPGRVAPRRASS
ncbi:MAG: hypothetical protein M3292_00335, partial [Actinomycetota bacterium]|nr:hypothetical protein [Actinomycetota bacterium]